jgi:hypothetical protein
MTDEQINQRIAEACGWRWDQGYRWKDSSGLSAFAWDIPDYCTDLNAMHEAEEVLVQNNNWRIGEYEARLFSSVGEMNNLSSSRGVRLCFHATARQRAEAFLRTLGKWYHIGDTTEMVKEVQK